MDTGGKVALIGCLAEPVSSLFPDGGGAVAALVEQHIGLIGLKLVLCEWSHAVGEDMEGEFEKRLRVCDIELLGHCRITLNARHLESL